jgi:predicted RNA-binding protein with TRAM domain
VDVTEVSRRGDGVARIEGFVIFVAGAKAGQKVTARITSVSDRYAQAEIVSGTPPETQA